MKSKSMPKETPSDVAADIEKARSGEATVDRDTFAEVHRERDRAYEDITGTERGGRWNGEQGAARTWRR